MKVDKMNIIINQKAALSSELTFYLINHPKILNKYSDHNFIIFAVGKDKLNRSSNLIAAKHLEKNKSFVRAIRKKSSYNKWLFEPFSTHNYA